MDSQPNQIKPNKIRRYPFLKRTRKRKNRPTAHVLLRLAHQSKTTQSPHSLTHSLTHFTPIHTHIHTHSSHFHPSLPSRSQSSHLTPFLFPPSPLLPFSPPRHHLTTYIVTRSLVPLAWLDVDIWTFVLFEKMKKKFIASGLAR